MAAKATSARNRGTDTTVSVGRAAETEIAEHERQFREILEYCPAALIVVDEDGRLLFHNARLRELLGLRRERAESASTPGDSGTTSINARGSSRAYASVAASCSTRKWSTRRNKVELGSCAPVLPPGRLPGRSHQLRRRQAGLLGLRHHRAQGSARRRSPSRNASSAKSSNTARPA